PAAQIELLAGRLAADGTYFKRLNIAISAHSSAMATAARALREFAAGLPVHRTSARILSNVTGDWADEHYGHPDYWHDHLVSPVRFAEQLQRVAALRAPVVIGVGPDEGLSRMIDHEIGARVGAVIPSAGASAGPDPPHARRVPL